jgi:hypothetical protein
MKFETFAVFERGIGGLKGGKEPVGDGFEKLAGTMCNSSPNSTSGSDEE